MPAKDIFKDSLDKKKESGAFVKTLFSSLIPGNYTKLSSKPFREAFLYLVKLVLISFGVLLLLVLLNIASLRLAFDKEFAKIEDLNISVSFKLTEPIKFDKQDIVIANSRDYRDENLLITNEGIVRKPVLCMFFSPACWFRNQTVSLNATEYSTIADDNSKLSTGVLIMILLMLPMLLLAYLIYYALKLAIIILVVTLLGYAGAKAFGYQISLSKSLMVAVYSSTIIAVLEPFNLMMLNLYYAHIIFFLGFFIVALLMSSDRKHRYDDA
jgi:hypothetical protein